MNQKTPFLIEVNLDDYEKVDTLDDLLFFKTNKDKSENLIDKGLSRLIKYVYDDFGRCVENVIYKRTNNWTIVDDEESLVYQYHSTAINSYHEGKIKPFRTKYKTFWVHYSYDKKDRLTQAISSKGSSFKQKYEDDILVEKKYIIAQKDSAQTKEYVFRYEDNNLHFSEYEDSDGNYWSVELPYPSPFYNPRDLRTKFNDNIDFI
jgi:hypothetical protein